MLDLDWFTNTGKSFKAWLIRQRLGQNCSKVRANLLLLLLQSCITWWMCLGSVEGVRKLLIGLLIAAREQICLFLWCHCLVLIQILHRLWWNFREFGVIIAYHSLFMLLRRLMWQCRGDWGATFVVFATGYKLAPKSITNRLLSRAIRIRWDLHNLLSGIVRGTGERRDRANDVFILPTFTRMSRQFNRTIVRHLLGLSIHHIGQIWVVCRLLLLFVRSYARFFANTFNEEAS